MLTQQMNNSMRQSMPNHPRNKSSQMCQLMFQSDEIYKKNQKVSNVQEDRIKSGIVTKTFMEGTMINHKALSNFIKNRCGKSGGQGPRDHLDDFMFDV